MADQVIKPKFKRKQYLVAKKFQLKYVGLILLLMFLTAALCSYVVYYTSMILFAEKLANVYPQGRLVAIVRLVNLRIMLSAILVSPLVALIGLFLSHRIAGPIFRMENLIGRLAAGDLTGGKLVLRQGDELVALADKMNNLSESLRSTIIEHKSRLSRVSKELEDLKKVASGKAPGINDIFKGLDKEVQGLRDEFDKYKV